MGAEERGMTPCPAVHVLDAWVSGRLSDPAHEAEAERVSTHVDSCARCRDETERLGADRAMLSAMRAAMTSLSSALPCNAMRVTIHPSGIDE